MVTFSIIIPLFNKELSLGSTIESVLSQTWVHFELVIVNDGSTDRSLEVAQSFNDQRIKLINQANQGVSNARNRGIQVSQNDYIVFLDADDIWKPYALEELVYLINNFPRASVFAANFAISDITVKDPEARYYVKDYYYQAAILLAKWGVSLLIIGAVALKRDCFRLLGGFREGITHGEDVEFWDRISSHFTIAKSERVILVYRINAENRASDLAQEQKKFPEFSTLGRSKVLTRSMQLYYGCLFLQDLKLSIKNYKIKYAAKLLFSYFNWIWNASILFLKHRLLTR